MSSKYYIPIALYCVNKKGIRARFFRDIGATKGAGFFATLSRAATVKGDMTVSGDYRFRLLILRVRFLQ